MKPLRFMNATIKEMPELHLHVLLTEEDDVIVARCLDFSISSHGENESEALASLSDCIKDYLDYAVNNSALDEIIDPDDEQFWKIYRELELKNESSRIVRNALTLKKGKIKEVIYA